MKRKWVKGGAAGGVLLLRCSCLGDKEGDGDVDNCEGGSVVNAVDMGMELTIPKSLNLIFSFLNVNLFFSIQLFIAKSSLILPILIFKPN